jgi:membrane associated rhomboid family serine protease
MIPLNDSVASRRQPIVTLTLIGLCALIFVYELTLRGLQLDLFVERWGAVPQLILAALGGDPRVPKTVLITLVTSQFIHAGFLHFGGNAVFLWVFGRAVEDRLGSGLFLGFYLLAGAIAGLVQVVIEGPSSTVPLIGASGAIAGVLGMYFVSYPGAWVTVIMPVLFFFWAFDLPAIVVLGFWFLAQFFQGLAAITTMTHATVAGGVAIWAHLTGFVFGALAARVLPQSSSPRPAFGRSGATRRGEAPGPARLVSSVADLLAVLLVARLIIVFIGLSGPRSPLAGLAAIVLAATSWLVQPFHDVLPNIRVGLGVIELAALAAIVVVYVVAGLISQVLVKTTS